MYNILVTDDDMINRKLLIVMLKKAGKYNIIEAQNGLEALDIVKASNPKIDLILLDIIMPVMDGLDFLKILKSEPEFSELPVVILTTDDSKRNEAMQSGALDVIIKPIKEIQIKETLNRYLP